MNLLTKRLPLIALMSVSAAAAMAAPVTPEQAKASISNFRQVNRNLHKVPQSGELNLVYTQTSDAGNCFYVFNAPNGKGFTIASADDRLPSVLGFTDNGTFDEANLNDNLRYWLGEYTKEISGFLAKDPDVAPYRAKARPMDYAPIEPLCTTKWNQGKPFNNDCPYDSWAHSTSVTGCVATAMAQVMKYHNWPVNPTGSRNGYIFSNTTLKWEDMIDVYEDKKYSGTQAAAVAQLMRQCGASVDMQYSAYASGAYENDVQVALRTYFDYDPNLELHYRDYFTYSEWNKMVYDELSTNGPVFYCGQSNAGGHAFVCDGYLGNNFYHFNWGWGGYQDGYFLLNALNPATGGAGSSAGGYNANQSIMTGVKKNQNSGTIHLQESAISTGAFTYSNNKFQVTGSTDNVNLIYNPLATTYTATFGVKIVKYADNSEPRYVTSGSRSMARWSGFSDMTVTMPSLADGKYKVSPAMRTSWGEWQDVGVPYGYQRYVTMEVKNGKATYTNEGAPADQVSQLVAGEPMMISKLYENAADAVKVTVTNIGDGDFMGKVFITLEDADDPFGDSFSADKWVSIPSHFTLDIEFTSDYQLPAANYLVEIIDTNYSLLYSGKTVKVEESDFEYFEPGDVYAEDFEPRFYTQSDEGVGFVFTGYNEKKSNVTLDVTIDIADMNTLQVLKSIKGEGIVLEKQSDRLVNFSNVQLDLPAGGYYVFVKDGDGNMLCPPVPFSIYSDRKEENGIYYIVTSEVEKKAIIVSPATSDYTGHVEIPAQIGGYDVAGIKADAFTFAENMESVTIPANITVLQDGTFYFADGLKEVHCQGTVPPSVSQYAFGPEIAAQSVLYTPAGYANYYAAELNWADFLISNWTINTGAGVEITDGLEIDPLTSVYFAPYYVSADEQLKFMVTVPAGKFVKAEWNMSDGTTGTKNFDGTVLLPVLGGRSASVNLSVTDESGVDLILSDRKSADVYGIDGRIVIRNADADALRNLERGIYIIGGKKIKR